jgi:hypothetical protein
MKRKIKLEKNNKTTVFFVAENNQKNLTSLLSLGWLIKEEYKWEENKWVLIEAQKTEE